MKVFTTFEIYRMTEISQKKIHNLDVVIYNCNSHSWEAEAGRS
jgi:hypothetical protein